MPATYFLPPSWDIDPTGVSLGSVIANVKTPDKALSAATLPHLIDTNISPPEVEKLYSGVARQSKEWNAGLFATFIQVITLGGELSVSSNSTIEIEYSCESVTTHRFTPSLEYTAKAVQDNSVKDHLKMGGVGARVFMVTGYKVAHQATITTTEESGKETNVQLGVEIPAIPITIGPKGSRRTSDYRKTTKTIEGPFIFAFQVEKIRVSRRGKVSHKGYIDGAMLARGKEAESEYIIERAGPSLEDNEIEDFDVDVRSGFEDDTGETCEIIVPYLE